MKQYFVDYFFDLLTTISIVQREITGPLPDVSELIDVGDTVQVYRDNKPFAFEVYCIEDKVETYRSVRYYINGEVMTKEQVQEKRPNSLAIFKMEANNWDAVIFIRSPHEDHFQPWRPGDINVYHKNGLTFF